MISPQPNLITRRAGRLLLVWTLTIDLSGMGGPTRRTKSPASIALRITETHKPVHHDKVAVSTEQALVTHNVTEMERTFTSKLSYKFPGLYLLRGNFYERYK